MPDPNNPLETALRHIKDHIAPMVGPLFFEAYNTKAQACSLMTSIRAELLNYFNSEIVHPCHHTRCCPYCNKQERLDGKNS